VCVFVGVCVSPGPPVTVSAGYGLLWNRLIASLFSFYHRATMPDPAIEAYKAGQDYTEPTGKGVRKARVSYEWVTDPNNPLAPPRQRRVIEAADSGGKFGKWFKGGEKITAVPVRPMTQPSS
jgi:hypothetical protein